MNHWKWCYLVDDGKDLEGEKMAIFTKVERNVFIVTFNTDADKQRVMGGWQWLFDKNLFVLKYLEGCVQANAIPFDTEAIWLQLHNLPMTCIDEFYGERIRESIGKVLNVDIGADDIGWGCSLRVRVEVNLSKSLSRGRVINIDCNQSWMPIKYEKLPRVCFSCDIINHLSSCRSIGGDTSAQ